MVSNEVQAAIATESAAYNVPTWITYPLVMAESSGDPNARSGTGAVGLLQIEPTYPGAAGKNLTDPYTNLSVGLAQISNYLQAHPQDMQRSLSSFEDVISHTGWDQTNGWANEGVGEYGDPTGAKTKARYISMYNAYGTPGGGKAGQGVMPTVDPSGAVKQAEKWAAQGACDAFANMPGVGIFAGPVCALMGEAMDPKKAVLLLVAFVILIAAAFKVLDRGSQTVISVQQSGQRIGRAGGAIKKGAGRLASVPAEAAEAAA